MIFCTKIFWTLQNVVCVEFSCCINNCRAITFSYFSWSFVQNDFYTLVHNVQRFTLCSAEIWNSLEGFVRVEFISRILAPRTSSQHLNWQKLMWSIFAAMITSNGVFMMSSPASQSLRSETLFEWNYFSHLGTTSYLHLNRDKSSVEI